MRGGIAGVEFNRLSQLGLAASKIPIILHLAESQVGVGAGERGIEFQGLVRCSRRLGEEITRRRPRRKR